MDNFILETVSNNHKKFSNNKNLIINYVIKNPILKNDLLRLINFDETAVQVRTAYILEKITSKKQEPLNEDFLELFIKIYKKNPDESALIWYLLKTLKWFEVPHNKIDFYANLLFSIFNEAKSKIIKVESLSRLVELANNQQYLQNKAKKIHNIAHKSNIPSLFSRSNTLSKKYKWIDF